LTPFGRIISVQERLLGLRGMQEIQLMMNTWCNTT